MKLITLFTILIWTSLSQAQTRYDLEFDVDVEPAVKNQLLGDLKFIDSIEGDGASPLHSKIFGAVDGEAYTHWFLDRIFSVGKDDCDLPSAMLCVIPDKDLHKMWFTPGYTFYDHPQIARLSLAFHEARHTESDRDFWDHETCPTPFLNEQGQNITSIWSGTPLAGHHACDKTVFGSYGVQTIFLKNIAQNCSSCNEKVKADAEIYSKDQADRIIDPAERAKLIADFNAPPIKQNSLEMKAFRNYGKPEFDQTRIVRPYFKPRFQ